MRLQLRAWFWRLYHSSVAWSWALNGFRIAGGLILLPLILRILSRDDLGMYYVFVSLYALVPVADFGFSVSVARFVSYAMGGATELKAEGLVEHQDSHAPNFPLLWQLLWTTRRLFLCVSLITFVVVGVIGTWAVALRVHETSVPWQTWVAWAVTLAAIVLEIFSGWWNHFLRGMNEVLLSARIGAMAYGLKIVLAAVLLLAGWGLLAWPVAGLLSSVLQRYFSRQSCLRRLRGTLKPDDGPRGSLFGILWPNSWRVGLQFLSTYLAGNANALICLKVLGLAANAQYGLSVQITQICTGMASVWIAVKWPMVGQFRTRQSYASMRAVLWPRMWLQAVTYLALAAAAFTLGPSLLKWLGTNKQLLPALWFGLLLLNGFLEVQFSFWTTLLSIENRIPSLWPTVVSNVVSLTLVLVLINFTSLELGTFILAPLVVYSLFSYWYWPRVGARSLQTTWLGFTFGRPQSASLSQAKGP